MDKESEKLKDKRQDRRQQLHLSTPATVAMASRLILDPSLTRVVPLRMTSSQKSNQNSHSLPSTVLGGAIKGNEGEAMGGTNARNKLCPEASPFCSSIVDVTNEVTDGIARSSESSLDVDDYTSTVMNVTGEPNSAGARRNLPLSQQPRVDSPSVTDPLTNTACVRKMSALEQVPKEKLRPWLPQGLRSACCVPISRVKRRVVCHKLKCKTTASDGEVTGGMGARGGVSERQAEQESPAGEEGFDPTQPVRQSLRVHVTSTRSGRMNVSTHRDYCPKFVPRPREESTMPGSKHDISTENHGSASNKLEPPQVDTKNCEGKLHLNYHSKVGVRRVEKQAVFQKMASSLSKLESLKSSANKTTENKRSRKVISAKIKNKKPERKEKIKATKAVAQREAKRIVLTSAEEDEYEDIDSHEYEDIDYPETTSYKLPPNPANQHVEADVKIEPPHWKAISKQRWHQRRGSTLDSYITSMPQTVGHTSCAELDTPQLRMTCHGAADVRPATGASGQRCDSQNTKMKLQAKMVSVTKKPLLQEGVIESPSGTYTIYHKHAQSQRLGASIGVPQGSLAYTFTKYCNPPVRVKVPTTDGLTSNTDSIEKMFDALDSKVCGMYKDFLQNIRELNKYRQAQRKHQDSREMFAYFNSQVKKLETALACLHVDIECYVTFYETQTLGGQRKLSQWQKTKLAGLRMSLEKLEAPTDCNSQSEALRKDVRIQEVLHRRRQVLGEILIPRLPEESPGNKLDLLVPMLGKHDLPLAKKVFLQKKINALRQGDALNYEIEPNNAAMASAVSEDVTSKQYANRLPYKTKDGTASADGLECHKWGKPIKDLNHSRRRNASRKKDFELQEQMNASLLEMFEEDKQFAHC